MNNTLISEEISKCKVCIESSIRNVSECIERITPIGIPIYANELGDIKTQAERYFLTTSHEENERRKFEDIYLSQAEIWEQVNKHRQIAIENLDTLDTIISCLQKGFGDNVQYLDIRPSYRISYKTSMNNLKNSQNSLSLSEASKNELLLALLKKQETLKPLASLAFEIKHSIESNLRDHFEVLDIVSQLLPIWNIKRNKFVSNEYSITINNQYKASLNIIIPLPPWRVFLKQNEELQLSQTWLPISNLWCFSDINIQLDFYKPKKYYTQENNGNKSLEIEEIDNTIKNSIYSHIQIFDIPSHLIKNKYHIRVLFKNIKSSNLKPIYLNRNNSLPEVIIPDFLTHKLAQEIHSQLHYAHWILIDRAIFTILIHEIAKYRESQSIFVHIIEADSNSISFVLTSTCLEFFNKTIENSWSLDTIIKIYYIPETRQLNDDLTELITKQEYKVISKIRELFIQKWQTSISSSLINLDLITETNLDLYINQSKTLFSSWISYITRTLDNPIT
ncbi:hypothetical protein cand_000950 [Cryptosporidium andersoni]|uniref:Uncharacterized protein n=1 Tax=Cryptosporidium andersoni TaxID=117008 RepID=A0A1J4MQX0_9CRYT|nr:hypothetical protein cand_000950 [Cryptosporidium andersoni]